MSSRADLVKQILMLDALAAHAKTLAAGYRTTLADEAKAELERTGTAPTWRVPKLAQVILPVSHERIEVSNEQHLLEWVQFRYPAEVETISSVRVRPAFVTALAEKMLRFDGEVVIDPETGEIVPGLSVRQGGEPGALSIKAEPKVKASIAAYAADMMATSQLALVAPADLSKSEPLPTPVTFEPAGDPFSLFPPVPGGES